ncbi:hypothetical protein ACLEPN_11305 [Myxococcus sp. 1LA]
MLWNTQVSDENLRALVGLTGLRVLNLRETAVSDSGLAHLRNLPALRRLDLDETRVGDGGLRHLPHLNLNAVSLRRTQVTEEGVAWLRRECPELRISSAFKQYSVPESEKRADEDYLRQLHSSLKRE